MDEATDPHQELIDAFRATAKENAARAVARFDVFHAHVHHRGTPQQEHELNEAGLIVGEELLEAGDYYHAATIANILCEGSTAHADLHHADFRLQVIRAYASLEHDAALATAETLVQPLLTSTRIMGSLQHSQILQLAVDIIRKRQAAEKHDKPAPSGIVFAECRKDVTEQHIAQQLLTAARDRKHISFAQFLALDA